MNSVADNLLRTIANMPRNRTRAISTYLKFSMGEDLVDYIDRIEEMLGEGDPQVVPYTARLAALVSIVQAPSVDGVVQISEDLVNLEAARLTDEYAPTRTSDEGSRG